MAMTVLPARVPHTSRPAWDWTVAIYEWVADILADHPKLTLGIILVLLAASVF